jgi:hypothetical protein
MKGVTITKTHKIKLSLWTNRRCCIVEISWEIRYRIRVQSSELYKCVFQRNIVSAGTLIYLLFNPEGEDKMFLRNVGVFFIKAQI